MSWIWFVSNQTCCGLPHIPNIYKYLFSFNKLIAKCSCPYLCKQQIEILFDLHHFKKLSNSVLTVNFTFDIYILLHKNLWILLTIVSFFFSLSCIWENSSSSFSCILELIYWLMYFGTFALTRLFNFVLQILWFLIPKFFHYMIVGNSLNRALYLLMSHPNQTKS